MNRGRVHFEPRTKLFLLIAVNLVLLLSHAVWYECTLVLLCVLLLCSSGQPKSGMRFTILFLVMLAIDRFLVPYASGYVFTLLSFIVISLRKFLPCLMIGKWILLTTETGEFIAAMWKVRLPQTAIIPISVVFRYFPTIKEEWGDIRAAMKLRGIGLSLEHVMVPLLISAVNISEELSAAALCRGLDNPGRHTCMYEIGFKRSDKCVMGFCVFFVIVSFILKGAGII